MDHIIPWDRSIVISCDTDLITYKKILESTNDLESIGAYKIGSELGLNYGLPRVLEMTHHYNFLNKPLIYDHQAGGNDISNIGKKLSRIVRDAGFDAIIFKPKKNKLENLREHVLDAQDIGLKVMVVGKMTDEVFNSQKDIEDSLKIYETAFEEGVYDFGVPGNDLEFLNRLNSVYKSQKISYFPIGIGVQGGKLSEISKVLDYSPIHPIVGRSIYEKSDVRKASIDFMDQIS